MRSALCVPSRRTAPCSSPGGRTIQLSLKPQEIWYVNFASLASLWSHRFATTKTAARSPHARGRRRRARPGCGGARGRGGGRGANPALIGTLSAPRASTTASTRCAPHASLQVHYSQIDATVPTHFGVAPVFQVQQGSHAPADLGGAFLHIRLGLHTN